jgi:hypothetical protein
MSGKTFDQLTLADLRHECQRYGIVSSGTKADLEVQLREQLRDNGSDPSNTLFYTQEPSDRLGVRVDGVQGGENNDNLGDTVGPQDRRLSPAEIHNIGSQPSLEERLSTLESCMRHYFDDQCRLAETMRRIELGMRPPTTVPTEQYPRTQTQTYASTGDQGLGGQAGDTIPPTPGSPSSYNDTTRTNGAYEFGHSRTTTSNVRFDRPYDAPTEFLPFTDQRKHRAESTRLHTGPATHSMRAFEYSALIPYEDLRTAHTSLPEFSGTKVVDPVRF